jgi:hypothetical protein
MIKMYLFLILVCAFMNLAAWGLTDSELIAVRDGFEQRRNQSLDSQIASPWPDISTSWGKVGFAIAALYRNTQLDKANEEVIAACQLFLDGTEDWVDFHWKGNTLFRIYEFFKSDSAFFPGRLTPQAEAKICEVFWEWWKWAAVEKSVADISRTEIEQSRTWWIEGSENHGMMRKSTAWSAAKILKDAAPYNTYTEIDNLTPEQHFVSWTTFFKEYLKERGKRGVMVEIYCSYNPYTMQGWYNFYDFADDPVLKQRANHLLDLYWADWGQGQIESVRGGGKTRVYLGAASETGTDSIMGLTWYYLNKGVSSSRHPNVMCAMTSQYRMPLVVMDIALDTAGRGTYESKTRRLGLNILPRPAEAPPEPLNSPTYVLDPDNGGILDYKYCTADFIIGSLMLPELPTANWSSISCQNRWHGVIFGGHRDARIFPQCAGTKPYNSFWSVQNKGTQITQRTDYTKYAEATRVFFSSPATGLVKSEENGWVFADVQNCYAAVKCVTGGYTWDGENWMVLNDWFSPIIMEVVSKSDYADFTAFKNAVKANTLTFDNGVLTYTGLDDSGTFTFYVNSSDLPKINGVEIDLAPSYTFESPFINEDWESGLVTITKGDRSLELDFGTLLNHWKLDESSGNIAQDSESPMHGNVYGNPVWSAQGNAGGALYFDGTDDYIDCGNSRSLNGEIDFTVMAWVKTDSATEQMVIQQRDEQYQGEYWVKLKENGKVNYAIYNGGYQFNFDSVKTVNDGQWHHVAVTRSGQTGTIYIDGIADASAGGDIKPLLSERDVFIGFDKLGGTKYFKGYLDDIRIYTVCLDGSDIQNIINPKITLASDINSDGYVNYVDFGSFANYWAGQAQDNVKFAVTSDNSGYAGYADVLDEITLRAGGPGDFMVTLGDMSPVSDAESMIEEVFGADFRWYPAVGKRERDSTAEMTYLRSFYSDNLSGTVNPGPLNAIETCYSFDAGPVHISVINVYYDGTSDTGTDGDVVAELRDWLADDLAASNKPWKLVFGHEPAFERPDDDYGDLRLISSLDKYPANRDLFWQLLQDNGVDAYICGQMHRYSLYQPYENGTYQLNVAESTGTGIYDCFLIINADSEILTFDVYRSLGGDSFNLVHSHTFNKALSADFNDDGSVDFGDVLVISREWLESR